MELNYLYLYNMYFMNLVFDLLICFKVFIRKVKEIYNINLYI